MNNNIVDKLVMDINEEDLAREHLKYFMLYTDPMADSKNGHYQIKDYHRKIIDALERVEKGELKRLMISVPSQHGKSRLCSEGFTSRALGRNPFLHIMLASYAQSLSEDFSYKSRELVRSDLYKNIFGDLLAEDSQGVKQWHTKKGGSYAATSVGSGFTGKRADLIIIDDPHKDQEEAMSELQRGKVWDWYRSVPVSRMRDETACIVIMTRWHEDDLCGRILEQDGDKREVINIPVYNDDGTVIRPEVQSKELIEEKRNTVGEAMFQAMYMGDPINEGGGDFKSEYFQYYERGEIFDDLTNQYKKELDVVTFIDPAISQQQRADSTTITTIGVDKSNNNIYLLELKRGKMLPDQIISETFDTVARFNPKRVGIETNQYQKMLEIEIRKAMRMRGTFFTLEGQTSAMNKNAKIVSVLQNRYSNMSILHPKRGQNVNELEAELLKFPNGKHDDCADGLAMAVMMTQSFNNNKKKRKIVRGNWTT